MNEQTENRTAETTQNILKHRCFPPWFLLSETPEGATTVAQGGQ